MYELAYNMNLSNFLQFGGVPVLHSNPIIPMLQNTRYIGIRTKSATFTKLKSPPKALRPVHRNAKLRPTNNAKLRPTNNAKLRPPIRKLLLSLERKKRLFLQEEKASGLGDAVFAYSYDGT